MRRTLILACLLPVLGGLVIVPAADAVARPTCQGKVATIVGTHRGDRLMGTRGPDVIVAGHGADRISGRGGNDVICGEGGPDRIAGGAGDDLLDGGDSTDTLVGGAGDDRLDGGQDSYTVGKYGAAMYGDILVPGPGDDEIRPGQDPGQLRIGQRPDTIRFGGDQGVSVKLGDPGSWGGATGEGTDRILGQQRIGIEGTDHDDVIVGAASQDLMLGNRGVDRLLGADGDDVLLDGSGDADSADVLDGGAGDDLVRSYLGPDEVLGGEGDDQLEATAGACANHDGGLGQDDLYLSGRQVGFDAGASAGEAGQPLCGSTEAVELLHLRAYGGPLSYRGTEGPDSVTASSLGPITAALLGGDDSIVSEGVHDDVIDAGDGVDTVDAGAGLDVCAHAESTANCESETSPAVPSCDGRVPTIVAEQGAVSPRPPLVGTPGDDVIFGSEFSETIDGGGGNDVICGRGGADRLNGGEGDDRLFGGLDSVEKSDFTMVIGDTLVGGPDNDHLDAGWDANQDLIEHSSPAYNARDNLDFSGSPAGITADLTAGTVTGEGADTVVVMPRLRLTGTLHADRITGGTAHETIVAGGGADVVDSGPGDDGVVTGGSADTAGDDATDSVTTGDGDDYVLTAGGGDRIDTGAGRDDIVATAEAGSVTVLAGADDDRVDAHVGALLLDGGAGSDALNFTNKRLRGPVALEAGALTAGGNVLVDLPGWERYSFSTSRVPWRFVGSAADETFAAYGATRVVALGRGGDDVLVGSPRADRLVGGRGSDRANALAGRDVCLSIERARDCERTR